MSLMIPLCNIINLMNSMPNPVHLTKSSPTYNPLLHPIQESRMSIYYFSRI